ncbi:RNAPII degradation factor [Diaporthe australafricana]|uniref:RNA polymerase II degradation factor 1 n=1 Tax=Diaporthe australafricana TaxID=127596 RepID=A0ABR3VWX1_9PEZI
MSDVQARPAASRGRGSGRGGRGGFTSRGGRNASRSAAAATNGDPKHDFESTALPTLEDQGEIGDLNKTYGSKVSLIKEVFPDWSEVDILYALKETDGDETSTIERIADGTISQWGEVQKPKDKKSKAKAKDNTFTTTTGADSPAATNPRTTRGGRTEGARGRGRATERGARGAARARSSTATTNGRLKENQPLSVPTEDSTAWDAAKNENDGGWAAGAAAVAAEGAWDSNAASDAASAPPPPAAKSAPAPEPAQSTVIPQGTAKTWASMLRQSTAAPKLAPQPPKEAPAAVPESESEPAVEPLPAPDEPPAPAPEPAPEQIAELSAEPAQEQAPAENPMVVVPEVALTPSQDQLTETNLEQVVDESHPPVTETAASETADSWDPRASTISANATPISASHAQHQAPKAPASGFAATASRATERAPIPRTPSQTQRRFLNQEEAVRMPQAANQQLERATVQFGAFNLNGSEDDIDGDREEPETRAQPPADSPVAQPRASLPPAPPAPAPEAFPPQKPAVALPSTTGPSGAPAPPTAPAAHQAPAVQAPVAQPPIQPAAQQQYGRFGQPAAQEQQSPFPQKPFDSYTQGNPSAAQSQFEGFPSQQQSQPQSQQPGGAYSSSADQYSSFYTADPQNRNPYNYYGQNYGQQQQTSQAPQDSGLAARAGFGGYGASQGDLASQYPQSANQSRFGAAVAQDPNSGNTTPNPAAQGQQPTAPSHPQGLAGQHQQQQQQQQHGNQFYNQPYYGQFYSNYMNQYGGYGQGGFPYGKGGGLYGQPHHYGMSQQQTPFEHGSSPATGYPQSSLHRNDSGGVASGLGDYGRAGSAQSGAQPGLGSAGFGGIHDTFGRGASYGAQAGQSFNAPATQPAASNAEKLEPYGDAKAASGPSPSLVGARPGSATNTGPSQTGLPPPQSAQPGMGYGGYPSHLQGHGGLHGAQSAATGYGMGAGSGQAHQNSPYSAYGAFGGNSYYGSGGPRHGGWGSNYGGGSNF